MNSTPHITYFSSTDAIPTKVINKFWRLTRTNENGCWEWLGAYANKHGYGRIYHNGVYYLTHRLSWVLHFGPIGNGLGVLHKCDNPNCSNPEHLFLGDQSTNMYDRWSKGRAGNIAKGPEAGQAKLTWEQVEEIRTLYRKGRFNQYELAEEFGLTQSAVSRIVNHKVYKPVSPDIEKQTSEDALVSLG